MKNLCRQKEISRRAQAAVANARGSEAGVRAGLSKKTRRPHRPCKVTRRGNAPILKGLMTEWHSAAPLLQSRKGRIHSSGYTFPFVCSFVRPSRSSSLSIARKHSFLLPSPSFLRGGLSVSLSLARSAVGDTCHCNRRVGGARERESFDFLQFSYDFWDPPRYSFLHTTAEEVQHFQKRITNFH